MVRDDRRDRTMNTTERITRAEGLKILTRCADSAGVHWSGGIAWDADDCPTCRGTNEAGWLRVPCSRYGSTSAECAPVAWRVAYLIARETGEVITEEGLDHVMSLVVNDSDEPVYIVREYGRGHYR